MLLQTAEIKYLSQAKRNVDLKSCEDDILQTTKLCLHKHC